MRISDLPAVWYRRVWWFLALAWVLALALLVFGGGR